MAGIVGSHSLIPDALYHAFATFGSLMSPELPLGRRQHEIITTMVSLTNRCHYWIESHAEFLRRVTLDDALVQALRENPASAPLTEQERVMVDYVVQFPFLDRHPRLFLKPSHPTRRWKRRPYAHCCPRLGCS
jgi:AhpD family alkylhydroperoxidase